MNQNPMQPVLISDEDTAPTILQPRVGGAFCLYQADNAVLLTPAEVERLIAVIGECHSRPEYVTTTPAKRQAKLMRYATTHVSKLNS
jgi:hypothetical protein